MKKLAIAGGSVLLVAFIAVTVVLGASGWRMHFLTTPSMGRALPVGSLVISKPTTVEEVKVGDVVTAKIPKGRTRTHRIVEKSPEGTFTKGDLNGVKDSIPVNNSSLVGRAVFTAHYMGWVVRMIPIIAIVYLVMWAISRRLKDEVHRSRYRVLGAFAGFALAILIVKPMLGASLLKMDVTADAATAHAVSTGIFPVQIDPDGKIGTSSRILSPTGTDGFAVDGDRDENGGYIFQPKPRLSLPWWIGLAAVVFSPFLWFYGQYRWVLHKEKKAGDIQPQA